METILARASKKYDVALLLVAALLVEVASAAAPVETASARVIDFLTNAHTGKEMQADQWLTERTRSADAFIHFGGLSALVRQSTARANKFGGLKSVNILHMRKVPSGYEISADVIFMRSHKDPANPAVPPNEEMVWNFVVAYEDDQWKLSF